MICIEKKRKYYRMHSTEVLLFDYCCNFHASRHEPLELKPVVDHNNRQLFQSIIWIQKTFSDMIHRFFNHFFCFVVLVFMFKF